MGEGLLNILEGN